MQGLPAMLDPVVSQYRAGVQANSGLWPCPVLGRIIPHTFPYEEQATQTQRPLRGQTLTGLCFRHDHPFPSTVFIMSRKYTYHTQSKSPYRVYHANGRRERQFSNPSPYARQHVSECLNAVDGADWLPCPARLFPEDGDLPWMCTLPVNHKGMHVATGDPQGTQIYASWPNTFAHGTKE